MTWQTSTSRTGTLATSARRTWLILTREAEKQLRPSLSSQSFPGKIPDTNPFGGQDRFCLWRAACVLEETTRCKILGLSLTLLQGPGLCAAHLACKHWLNMRLWRIFNQSQNVSSLARERERETESTDALNKKGPRCQRGDQLLLYAMEVGETKTISCQKEPRHFSLIQMWGWGGNVLASAKDSTADQS